MLVECYPPDHRISFKRKFMHLKRTNKSRLAFYQSITFRVDRAKTTSLKHGDYFKVSVKMGRNSAVFVQGRGEFRAYRVIGLMYR